MSKRVQPSKIGRVRWHTDASGAPEPVRMAKAPTGSTMSRVSAPDRGMRSGFSSKGGAISTPVTALPASAMRMVRVVEAFTAVVA